MNRIFGSIFILTGIFAILGGLYTWGDGPIYHQTELIKVLIPWADVILTGPLSLICGIWLLRNQFWAEVLGLVVSGIYVFGSMLVFINVVWDGNYAIDLILPAIAGMTVGISYIFLYIKNHPAKRRGANEAD